MNRNLKKKVRKIDHYPTRLYCQTFLETLEDFEYVAEKLKDEEDFPRLLTNELMKRRGVGFRSRKDESSKEYKARVRNFLKEASIEEKTITGAVVSIMNSFFNTLNKDTKARLMYKINPAVIYESFKEAMVEVVEEIIEEGKKVNA